MTHIFKKLKIGQAPLTVVILTGTFAVIGSWISGTFAANKQLYDVEAKVTEQIHIVETVNAVQDTNIETIKKDVSEIKTDLKTLLRTLGVKETK